VVKDYSIYYITDIRDNIFTKFQYKNSKCYQYINSQGGIYMLNKEKLENDIRSRKEMR
jgi:hypothetical protein